MAAEDLPTPPQQHFLPDDYGLHTLPLPSPVGYTPLADPLTEHCKDFLNRSNLDQLDRDFEALAKQVLRNNEQLRKLGGLDDVAPSSMPAIVQVPKTALTNMVSSVKSSTQHLLGRFWKKQEEQQEEPVVSEEPTPNKLPPDNLLLNEEELKDLADNIAAQRVLLLSALSVASRWLMLVDSLANKRTKILSRRVWQCCWVSPYSSKRGIEYETTCLRVHTIMLVHMVASMTFNFARRCEIYGLERSEFVSNYLMAFRLWDQRVRREILIINPHGMRDGLLPPEASPDAFVFFARLCLIKLQHAALVTYVRDNNLVYDSNNPALVDTEFTRDEAQLDESDRSRMIQERFLYGTTAAAAVRRYRIGTRHGEKLLNYKIATQVAMHLFVLVHSISNRERQLFLATHVQFTTCPTFSERHLIKRVSLLEGFQQLDLLARSHLLLFGAICYGIGDDDRNLEKKLLMARALYRLLTPDNLRRYLRQDQLLQFYTQHWTNEGILTNLATTMVDGSTLIRGEQSNTHSWLLQTLVKDLGPPLFYMAEKDWPTKLFAPLGGDTKKVVANDKMFIE